MRLVAMVLALWGLSLGSASSAALSAPPSEKNKARLDSTVRFLQEAQNGDGGFGGVKHGESDPDFSAWVALALAAAGINPRCQAQPGGVDAYTYLLEHARQLRLTTEFERVLLVVDATGTSARAFDGIDLVGEILRRQLSGAGREGAFAHEAGSQAPAVNDTIFAILALSPVHEPVAQDAIGRAASWLEGEQYPDGSWPSVQAHGEAGEVDMTGAAIEALNAAGRQGESQQRAFGYLHEAQNPDGGFPEFLGRGEESNVASTAWAVQGMWSAGQNPETWLQSAGAEPLSYMASLQQADGSIEWKASSDANPVWMTAYVAPTFAGQFLPIPTVPLVSRATSVPGAVRERREAPTAGRSLGGVSACTDGASTPQDPDSPTPPAPGSAEVGQGGESAQPGAGVIAGGGGDGAALFSRPQPQSRGRTPGGVRLLSDRRARRQHTTARARATGRRPRNPGARHKTQIPTITAALAAANADRDTPSAGSALTGTRTATSGQAAGSGSAALGGSAALARARGRSQAGAEVVKGLLVRTPRTMHAGSVLAAGAPGLHSAGTGGGQTPWLAIGIGALAVLLMLAGSQLERRRAQVIL